MVILLACIVCVVRGIDVWHCMLFGFILNLLGRIKIIVGLLLLLLIVIKPAHPRKALGHESWWLFQVIKLVICRLIYVISISTS